MALTSKVPLQAQGYEPFWHRSINEHHYVVPLVPAALLPTILLAPPLLYRQWYDEPFYVVEGKP